MSANYTPNLGEYTELRPFRYWCQKVLPLVYDDSLSYYELLCKVVDYLNKTMHDVDTLHTDVLQLHAAYIQLQQYVNTYFENLDIQPEINRKLDEMAESGALLNIIKPSVIQSVNGWLTENITNPSNPPIDKTLTLENAAANSKVTGDKINSLKEDLVNVENTVFHSITVVSEYVFKHIDSSGGLNDNGNKNLCFSAPVRALKDSIISVDSGYKFQVALYSDLFGFRFIKRVSWQTNTYVIDEDCYVRVEVSDINENPLSDKSIVNHLHFKLYDEKITFNQLDSLYENDILFNERSAINLGYNIGTQIDISGSRVDNYRCAVVECSYGDAFLLNVSGGNGPRAYGFIDENNILLECASQYTNLNNELIYAPQNAHKIIINDQKTNKVCKKYGVPYQNRYNIEKLKNEFSDRTTKGDLDKVEMNFLVQSNNLIDAFGISSFKNKVYTTVGERGYNAWSFVGKVGNTLVCLYTKGQNHTDDKSQAYFKTSNNGVIWSKEMKFPFNQNMRTNPCGKGNDSNGNLVMWLRLGNTGDNATFEFYKSVDGYSFEKLSSPIFDIKASHIGDILYVENLGLICFYNTFWGARNSYGYLLSTDNGYTWSQHEIGTTAKYNDLPVEISAVNLGNGKILALARSEISAPMFQIETSDYGRTWNTSVTNISDVELSTPSLILDGEYAYAYYYDRGRGKLRVRKSKYSDIFNNPTNWSESEEVASGAIGYESAGNVNATLFNGVHIVTYYSGNPDAAQIYNILK